MKLGDLLRRRSGCQLDREGARHSIWINPATGKKAPVPRHSEIDNRLVQRICRQLDVPALK
jgi:hypothetical protein